MHIYRQVLLVSVCFFSLIQSKAQELNERSLIKSMVFLSSDDLAGRKTGDAGNLQAREFIADRFAELKLDTHYSDYLQSFSFEGRRDGKKYEGVNVVGFIPGTSSQKLIVVTAHYDHVGIGRKNAEGDSIYNGADDNASGTAALLEFAAYFAENPPKHGIFFAAVDAEEMGLQGAKALVRDFPFSLDQVALNVNMDMISRNEKGEIYVSGTYYYPELKEILEPIALDSKPKLLFGHDVPGTGSDDWTRSSDHGVFFEKQIPHLYFGVEDHSDYHQPSDEYKNIDPEFFVSASSLILRCLLTLDEDLLKE
ncbi:M28 family peptidase [Algoriphagus hitonicola]|uniref:Peptidase family M28 n=1 Tax=Algoriphagus hitonicola TaxID=435880 RepID=A0A1I2Q9Y4_9BACT|nr:M28 family peptidase [Algoriphagus hitonicola]SFG24463.1 Peptidase family M28 [Algoriphagus hitonicola]